MQRKLQIDVGNEEMNVRCNVCRLGRPFVTAGKLQQVKNSKSKRAPSCWNKLFLPPFLNKWKPCHGAINNWSRKLRTALERHFRFYSNCKKYGLKRRKPFQIL